MNHQVVHHHGTTTTTSDVRKQILQNTLTD